jgi:hypothetical protein
MGLGATVRSLAASSLVLKLRGGLAGGGPQRARAAQAQGMQPTQSVLLRAHHLRQPKPCQQVRPQGPNLRRRSFA